MRTALTVRRAKAADRPQDDAPVPDDDRWNHNLHVLDVLLDALPRDLGRTLDVGCGEGVTSRRLAGHSRHVVGLDPDQASAVLAAAQRPPGVGHVRADLRAAPFPPASFDTVVAVAVLHHTGAETGLLALRDLVRPGGHLGVVGLARTRSPVDLAHDLAGAAATRVHQRARGLWETPAPKVWPPPETYGQVRRVAERVLPGVRYRRHALWRYTVLWNRPS